MNHGASVIYRDVEKSYGAVQALKPTSLEIKSGEFFSVSSDDSISEKVIYDHWSFVESADRDEIKQFVGDKVWQLTEKKKKCESGSVVVGVWV